MISISSFFSRLPPLKTRIIARNARDFKTVTLVKQVKVLFFWVGYREETKAFKKAYAEYQASLSAAKFKKAMLERVTEDLNNMLKLEGVYTESAMVQRDGVWCYESIEKLVEFSVKDQSIKIQDKVQATNVERILPMIVAKRPPQNNNNRNKNNNGNNN